MPYASVSGVAAASIGSVAGVAAGGAGGDLSDQHYGSLLTDGVDTVSSIRLPQLTVTASATPHSPGSWVEVDASLSADAGGVVIIPQGTIASTGADGSTLLEIGTGSGGAETVWATLGVGYRGATGGFTAGGPFHIVPGFIASGTRVAVRARSAVASQTVNPFVLFLPADKTIDFGAPTTFQANTGTSRGLTLTAPGSLNTKGGWTELVASTAQDFNALCVCPQGAAGTGMVTSGVLVDIGIGASTAETVLIGDLYGLGNTSEFYTWRTPMTYGVDIPAGSRLSARYQRAGAGNAVDLIVVAA